MTSRQNTKIKSNCSHKPQHETDVKKLQRTSKQLHCIEEIVT
jgi:hypothetical protein